jgi:hypothetical protein
MAHYRRVVDRRWRIASVVDNLQSEFLGVLARAGEHVVRKLGIRADQRYGLRSRLQRFCHFEKGVGQHPFRVGSKRRALEILRILEHRIGAERQQHHDHLLAFHDLRHCGHNQIGGMPHQQVDLIDVDELSVDAGYDRGVGLVVVVDELDRAAEEPTLSVDLL